MVHRTCQDLRGQQHPGLPLSSLSGIRRAWAVAAMGFDTRHLDAVNPALLNHDVWYSTHDWSVPYPGDDAVLTPDQARTRFPLVDD